MHPTYCADRSFLAKEWYIVVTCCNWKSEWKKKLIKFMRFLLQKGTQTFIGPPCQNHCFAKTWGCGCRNMRYGLYDPKVVVGLANHVEKQPFVIIFTGNPGLEGSHEGHEEERWWGQPIGSCAAPYSSKVVNIELLKPSKTIGSSILFPEFKTILYNTNI